ncbi:hypothetical protein [Paenibacillus pini]|uniref:Uncharacterized protein n=1 Tax=Paenibacillus pini JCM 16418 TaxID=1236976 RepID=W7YKZ2_9BACL|nr:hypothetical protein [Paenibacillus pini]GAF08383.1 hypothetical protein JCM16418_2457 [Paenibacillus pini JCM 16418]
MTKVELMDTQLASYEGKLNSSEICRVVEEIFGFNLDPAQLGYNGDPISGADIRKLINQKFGVNLDGVASLEKAKISLYSKGQWVVRNEHDLITVLTGTGDVDVKVLPTAYFMEQTGIQELPNELQQSLTSLGYSYDEEVGGYYYSNPSGKAVPDAFKGQTIGAIVQVIQQRYSDL